MRLLWRYLFQNVQTFNHDIDILTFLSIGAEVYKVLVLREIQAQVFILNSLASKYFQTLRTLRLTGKYPPESVGYHGSIENMGIFFIIKQELFTLKCFCTSTVTCLDVNRQMSSATVSQFRVGNDALVSTTCQTVNTNYDLLPQKELAQFQTFMSCSIFS